MLWLFALLGLASPPPPLVQVASSRDPAAALRIVDQTLGQASGRSMPGLRYLRGHLLEALGRPRQALGAFASSLSSTPELAPWSRYHLARLEVAQHHPEVAAGLMATLLAHDPPSPLIAPASRLLRQAMDAGGDCRLLVRFPFDHLPPPDRRLLEIAEANCQVRRGQTEGARQRLLGLVNEDPTDGPAQEAAERYLQMTAGGQRDTATQTALARVFFEHRELERATGLLQSVVARLPHVIQRREDFAAVFLLARCHYWNDDFAAAARLFDDLARRSTHVAGQAHAFYQEGRSLELLGEWPAAVGAFSRVDENTTWRGPALLSSLRLVWCMKDHASALRFFDTLRSQPRWGLYAARGALFLAASELAAGETAHAGRWLIEGVEAESSFRPEVHYWLGRWEEQRGRPQAALGYYLRLLRQDMYHPLALSARRRLADADMVPVVRTAVGRWAASPRLVDRYAAWLLLPPRDRRRQRLAVYLYQRFANEPELAPYLRLAPVDVSQWPLWREPFASPQSTLLALGRWQEVELSTVLRFFPLRQPDLAFTASRALAASGSQDASLYVAQALLRRIGGRVPLPLLPVPFRKTLLPLVHAKDVVEVAGEQGLDPFLLLAVLDADGHLVPAIGRSEDEAGPVSERRQPGETDSGTVVRTAKSLAHALATFSRRPELALAAYHAGDSQARLWRAYTGSDDPDELFTKIGFRDSRAYLVRVLSERQQFAELYPGLAGPEATP